MNASKTKTSLLLVDDHAIFLDGLQLLLETQPDLRVETKASSSEEALVALANFDIDVLITDIHMPGKHGNWLIQEACKRYPDLKTIALTMLNDQSQISDVLESGADAYLLKNTHISELSLAIDCVMSGNVYLSKEVNQILHKNPNTSKDLNRLLTEREHEVLSAIVDGLSSKMIAAKQNVSIDTIKFHRKNILSKLNQPNAAALVRFAIENRLV